MSRDRREDPGQYYPGGSVIPKTPTPSGGVGGDGDVRHVDFADIDIKKDMTLKEVGSMVNTLVQKLKGPALLLLSACCFSSLAAITPDTDFGDISPTNKIEEVVAAAGAVMAEDDPNVPLWAKQPNPPEGMPTTGLVWNATAGAVKTANGLKTIGAADVGALSTNGGFVAGNITIKDNTAIKFKTYEPDFDAEIRLGDSHSAMVFDALSNFYLNTKTTEGWERIYFNGQKVALENWQSLSAMLDSANANNLAINQTFSNAVLAVGLNIDTNSVAVLNEIAETFGGFPIEETATTVGGLLAALAAAVAWLKKNKVQTLKLEDGSVETSADGGVAKLDDFFTDSNSLLMGTIAANSARLALDEDGEIIVTMNTED